MLIWHTDRYNEIRVGIWLGGQNFWGGETHKNTSGKWIYETGILYINNLFQTETMLIRPLQIAMS